jgi:hypothetical protein
MAHLVDIEIGLSGLALIVVVFLDVFQSIIVPHYTPKGTRLSPRFISKILWQPIRSLVKALPDSAFLQGNLTMFAPAAMMSLISCWLVLMTFGYSLILWAERSQVKPPLGNLGEALYFAATSVLTIGYGDLIACTPLARATVICAAVSGLVLLAITVSFLFAIQSHFHLREVNSQIISSRHEHSANGAMFYHNLRKEAIATSTLELCERWLTEVYQSHSAYPLLLYFRSRSTKASWLVQFGVVLDAAAIGLALDSQKNRVLKRSIYDNGSRALAVFSNYLSLSPRHHLEIQDPQVFEQVFHALGAPNYIQAAANFAELRQHYYPELHALAEFLLIALPPLSVIDAEQLEYEPGANMALPKDKKHVPGMTAIFDWPPGQNIR